MKETELEKVVLLEDTLLVEVLDDESTTKSGLVLSSQSKLKKGKVVKVSTKTDKLIDVFTDDIVLLNPHKDTHKVFLDGNAYELATNENVLLVLERN